MDRAERCLDYITEGLNLTTAIEEEDLEADVALVPGGSSASPEIKVKVKGEWVSIRTESTTTSVPLAAVESNKMNMQLIRRVAEKSDPGLAAMLRAFFEGDPDKTPDLSGT